MTGTPVGTALNAPPKWKAFFNRQAANPKYLRDGHVIEAGAATADGAIDLDTQRMTVHYTPAQSS